MSKIECIIEPELYCSKNGETVRVNMRCRLGDDEFDINRIENVDFMRSNFDLIFDHMREDIRYKFIKEVDKKS